MSQQSSPNSTVESEIEDVDNSFEESDIELENEAVAKFEVESQGDDNQQLDENSNINKFYVAPVPATEAANDQKTIKKKSTQVMVDMALNSLNERMGSSLPAIKKYILQNFESVSEKRLGFFVLKYLKKSIEEGKIKRNKGKYKIISIKVTAKKLKKNTINKDKKKKIPTEKIESKAVNDDGEASTSKQIKPRATADIIKQKSNKTVTKKKKSTTTAIVKATTAVTTKTAKKLTNDDAEDVTKDPPKVIKSAPTTKKVTKKVTKKITSPTLKINVSLAKIKSRTRTARENNKPKAAKENPSKALEMNKTVAKSKVSKKK